jgi:DtxR family Mn-dependent transcriptional regulator
MVIRKHRMWEYFLVNKLGMNWDEVHVIAEQLEHVDSEVLIERLDAFLGYPTRDPHGDPIPDSGGRIVADKLLPLRELEVGRKGTVVSVNNHNPGFLRHLSELGLLPETRIELKSRSELDGVMAIRIGTKKKLFYLGAEVAGSILIKASKNGK